MEHSTEQAKSSPTCCERLLAMSLMLFLVGFSGIVAGQLGGEPPIVLQTNQLKCEHLTNPIGIEASQPRLSWLLKSNECGQSRPPTRSSVGYQPRESWKAITLTSGIAGRSCLTIRSKSPTGGDPLGPWRTVLLEGSELGHGRKAR